MRGLLITAEGRPKPTLPSRRGASRIALLSRWAEHLKPPSLWEGLRAGQGRKGLRASTPNYRGRPSPRVAMTLRWIWFVPPMIE